MARRMDLAKLNQTDIAFVVALESQVDKAVACNGGTRRCMEDQHWKQRRRSRIFM